MAPRSSAAAPTARSGCGGPPTAPPSANQRTATKTTAAVLCTRWRKGRCRTALQSSSAAASTAPCAYGGSPTPAPVGEPLRGPLNAVYAVVVGAQPDGTPVIISGAAYGTVWVWRTADGTRTFDHLSAANGAGVHVYAVAAGALPDGTPVFISGASGGTMKVWRTANGHRVGWPEYGGGYAVRALAAGVLPDGTPVIISASDTGIVKVLQTPEVSHF